MIPRHRERLAQSIGNALGNELVSQNTVFHALFETGFFSRKVEGFVNSYTTKLLSTVYPSLIEALPTGTCAPVLDTIAALRYRLQERRQHESKERGPFGAKPDLRYRFEDDEH